MPDEILLNEAAYAVWQTVKEKGPIELGEVVKLTGIDQAQVSAAATEAEKQGFFEIEEREREEIVDTRRCRRIASQSDFRSNLPRRHLAEVGGEMPMAEVHGVGKVAQMSQSMKSSNGAVLEDGSNGSKTKMDVSQSS